MSRQRKADLLLVLATAFWGVSYFLLDLCLTELPPLTLNAFRFLTAFFVLGAIFFRKLRGISRRTLLASIPIGLCLVLTYIGCTYGVLYTSLSNAGFICALPVVVTPLLEWLFLRKRPDRRLAVALVLCTVGMGLMTLNGALRPALGDIICLLCAVAYAWRSPACHRPLPCGERPCFWGCSALAWASSSRRCSSSTPPPAMWG